MDKTGKVKSKHYPHSLKRKTWRFFLVVLSIFCIVLVASYTVTVFRAAVDNEVSSSRIAMTGISKNISSILSRYTEMSRLIMLNRDVVDFLRGSGSNIVYNATKVRDGICWVNKTPVDGCNNSIPLPFSTKRIGSRGMGIPIPTSGHTG